jgi:hypothetical protein
MQLGVTICQCKTHLWDKVNAQLLYLYLKFYKGKKENTTTRAKFCEGKKERTLRPASGSVGITAT